MADALGKLVLTSSGEAALATADLVVEAITENLPLKQEYRDHVLKFLCMEVYEVDLYTDTTSCDFRPYVSIVKRFWMGPELCFTNVECFTT